MIMVFVRGGVSCMLVLELALRVSMAKSSLLGCLEFQYA